MTNEAKNEIVNLRKAGNGYKSIARELGLTRDAVRSYCKRAGLDGVMAVVQPNMCNQCGSVITQKTTGRTRRFCSDECRRDWWSDHPDIRFFGSEAIYSITCAYCGEIFESYGNNKRKYCCHEHYIAARFNTTVHSYPASEVCDGNPVNLGVESEFSVSCLDNMKMESEYPILAIKSLNDSGSVLIDPNKLCNTNLPDGLFLNRIFLVCCKSAFHGKFDRFAGRVPYILEMNLINGDAFVFSNRLSSQVSILQWQGDGFALYFKRSDYGRFPWPKNAKAEVLEITHSDLKMLLEYPRFLLRLSGEETPSAII